MTRVAGTACIVGMAPQGTLSRFDPLTLVNKETRIIGTWYGSPVFVSANVMTPESKFTSSRFAAKTFARRPPG